MTEVLGRTPDYFLMFHGIVLHYKSFYFHLDLSTYLKREKERSKITFHKGIEDVFLRNRKKKVALTQKRRQAPGSRKRLSGGH